MSRASFLARYKLSRSRIEVAVTRADGTTEFHRGPTMRQLRRMHKHGNCGAMCSYCYHEATKA